MFEQWSMVLSSLVSGMPVLITHLFATTVLLITGTTAWIAITPFREIEQIRLGNTAAGLAFCGTVIALAIPLGATLSNSQSLVDVVVWGGVALGLQLIALLFSSLVIRGLAQAIQQGNVAAALALVGVQLATALLTAAAMSG